MARRETMQKRVLGLRAGEVVEVRSAAEILATLDVNGALDSLPFMPEMLQYCGGRFRVFKRADKTCDTIGPPVSRRMRDAVHLEGLRCDGGAHDGCQAQCLLFWKEAWLKRPAGDGAGGTGAGGAEVGTRGRAAVSLEEAARVLDPTTRRQPESDANRAAVVFVCQATEMQRATHRLPWWDVRQYVREVRSGNITVRELVRGLSIAAYNAIQRRLGGRPYPRVAGQCEGATPTARCDLKPGERVRIKPAEEIFATLNQRQRNRGLWFDVEMVPYCGSTAVVKDRVERIIDEKTGRMVRLPNDCIMLEGVTCRGHLSRERLFCPRSIYPYWREIWLERVAEEPDRSSERA